MTGFGKDGKGQIIYAQANAALTTLASLTAAQTLAGPTLGDDFRITKIDWFAHWVNPGGAGEMVLIGLADGELSTTEIEECLEATPTDSNDHLALERAHRPVWPVAIFARDDAEPSGKQGSIKPMWTFKNTEGWQWWAYNLGSGALTTGSSMKIFTKNYGVWV